MRVCFVCFLSIAVVCAGHAHAAESIKPAVGREAAVTPSVVREATVLESCEPGECPVFYIWALSRTFPIPNRYMLTKERSPSLRFTSPVPDLSTIEAFLAGRELNGSIVHEPRAMLAEATKTAELQLELLKKIDGVELYAVSIPPSSSMCCFETDFVALVGPEDYLMIADDNRKLPELLLGISRRVREQADIRNRQMQR